MSEARTISMDRLSAAVRDDAAIRRVRRLQPVGGPGDKIFPPTYPGERKTDPPRHVFERRRISGSNVLCVLVDSVQSQANRLEEALQSARDAKLLHFPAIAVDFSGTSVADIGRITTLQAPHRVFDAIVRDSELGGKPFRKTPEGEKLVRAKAGDARALYEVSPTALVFGAWNSTGEGGGLGAKFPRTIVSEIIGVGVATEPLDGIAGEHPSGQRTGSRIDPLGIRAGVRVYKTADGDWTLTPPDKKAKELRPSEINHSNIAPSVTPLGVSIDHALHSFVLSFAALRRLRVSSGSTASSSADIAGHTALAALGLAAAAAQDRAGYWLRSRCELVPENGSAASFEIVRTSGEIEVVSLDFETACALVRSAAEAAARAGVAWRSEDVLLKPQKKLVELIEKSREQALRGEAGPEEQE